MKTIKLPALFMDPKFWLAVAAGGLTFVGWRSGAVAPADAVKYGVGIFVGLKVALGLSGSQLGGGGSSGGGAS